MKLVPGYIVSAPLTFKLLVDVFWSHFRFNAVFPIM